MTRVRTVVVVGLMAMLAIGVWAAGADLPTDPFDIPWQEREIYKPGLIENQWPILDRLPGATVYHIDMDALEDPTALSGVESVHYTNREDVALDEIVFHLFANATGSGDTILNSALASLVFSYMIDVAWLGRYAHSLAASPRQLESSRGFRGHL